MPLQDDGPDTGPHVVRALLELQLPEFAGLPLDRLTSTGSDNALYRLGGELVVRLPRFCDAGRRLAAELRSLPRLRALPITVPAVVYAGDPAEVYPFQWGVMRWLDGVDAWKTRHRRNWFGADLGRDLANVVSHLRRMPVADAPRREPGQRGGPLRALDDRMRWWLQHADSLLDARAVLRLWEECLEGATDDMEPALVHGDLIPGNLLVAEGRLTAVIDWGSFGAGDPAQDLDPAWSVLDIAGAAEFRQALEIDEPEWLRGRGFALEHAVGGVVSYTAQGHPLGNVMGRTLHRLLSRR